MSLEKAVAIFGAFLALPLGEDWVLLSLHLSHERGVSSRPSREPARESWNLGGMVDQYL